MIAGVEEGAKGFACKYASTAGANAGRTIAPEYSHRMTPLFFHRRSTEAPAKPATERDVVDAGSDFARKEKLVERFGFLPEDMKQAARETALSRFLDILLSHMRR